MLAMLPPAAGGLCLRQARYAPTFRLVCSYVLACPAAYEKPSLNRAWEAFLPHLPAILLIWVATVVISVVGFLIYLLITLVGFGLNSGSSDASITAAALVGQLGQLPFVIFSNLVGVLFVAVPAMHYKTGETITLEAAFQGLFQRPWRYLLAGVLFSSAVAIGTLLCILPGLAVALVLPVYVNKVFNGDASILDALKASFQAVYGSQKGWEFVGIQVLIGLLVLVIAVATCGLGAVLAVPVSSFYIQNVAYYKGVLS
jgi:hypothetical protein